MGKRKWELFKETAELSEAVIDRLELGLPPDGRIYDLAQLPSELKRAKAAKKINSKNKSFLLFIIWFMNWFGLFE
ncbi:hypothetical protein K8R32_00420 [bacterium]|nr:hypothetical protein [bacterium]